MVALPMIGGFGTVSEAPGFRWKPSVDWLCKGQCVWQLLLAGSCIRENSDGLTG